MANSIMMAVFALIGFILLVNLFTVLTNIFRASNSSIVAEEETNPLRDEIRSEINEKVKPH